MVKEIQYVLFFVGALKTNVKLERNATNEGGISKKSSRVKKNVKHSPKSNLKDKDEKPKSLAEIYMHRNNIRVILECTNATPIRGHSDIGYQCSFCVSEYANPADLKDHTIQNHVHDLKTKRDFTWDKIMDTFRVKLDITTLRCDLCGIEIDSLEPLMEHLIDSHDKKLYTDIKSHVLPFKFTDEALRCVFCSNVSSTFKALQEHMMIHFRNYICEQCDSGFINRKMLRNHSKTHDIGTFKCNSCPKVFDTLPKQKAHERRVHSGTKLNRCGYCNEKFRDFVQKVKHQKEMHGVQTETQKCQACDKVFKTQAALKTHVKRDHLIERPYQCTECDMAFFLKAGLKHHLVKHTGTKEFTCKVCCKSYGLKKILHEHMKIHSDNRCFKCEHCDMAFVQKSGLRGHMRSKHSDLI